MKRLSKLGLALALVAALPTARIAAAEDGFDYYVLALSWAPSWCRIEGDARDAPHCDPSEDAGFTLHGLWPQFERSYPEYCRTSARDPSRRDTARQADLFGSSGSAWHQWKKHGRCSGLSADDYYQKAQKAYETVLRPGILRRLDKEVSLAPKVIEAAFLEENESLNRDGITITCRDGHIVEARICLTKSLEFRNCGADIRRDCSASSARFPPIR